MAKLLQDETVEEAEEKSTEIQYKEAEAGEQPEKVEASEETEETKIAEAEPADEVETTEEIAGEGEPQETVAEKETAEEESWLLPGYCGKGPGTVEANWLAVCIDGAR